MKKATPLTDLFIHNLKEKLNKGKIHQVEVARELCISKGMLWQWLSRRKNPSSEYILKLEKYEKDHSL